jgi:AcrR family transcriptional regulator
VVDIVDAAGVAKGLFYWYFENKEALFRELAAEMRRRLRRQQAAAMDDSAPALTRLLQGSVALIVAGQRDGTVTDDDPAELLALSVVGTVGQFGHFHRTHRVELSLDELSGYVARLVARMLAADERTARASLAALRNRADAPAATV